MNKNPLSLNGIDFVELTTDKPEKLHQLFLELGFSKLAKHKWKNIDLYRQAEITFLLNYETKTKAHDFFKIHGPSISAMGWRVANSKSAYTTALIRGAAGSTNSDYNYISDGSRLPALSGIGESLIYLIEPDENTKFSFERFGFEPLQDPVLVPEKGFLLIDHLTNNVYKGTMQKWASFYKEIFGFEEVRYFDIKGKKTGLTSFALKSPCGLFCIPINEASEAKSQINEYLDEYHGPGIQHLAFLTKDLISSLQKLEGTSIKTLDINDEYYEKIYDRVPQVKEDRSLIQKHQVLVDGDAEGYLLQIFTKNLIGPIFIEFIQRENHLSFGEGNFQALFDSIERDQMKRGVL
ncbi:MAG: 4-hydroxyphenylpyruvate dioxygenase [Bdellovibrionota bacterium]